MRALSSFDPEGALPGEDVGGPHADPFADDRPARRPRSVEVDGCATADDVAEATPVGQHRDVAVGLTVHDEDVGPCARGQDADLAGHAHGDGALLGGAVDGLRAA